MAKLKIYTIHDIAALLSVALSMVLVALLLYLNASWFYEQRSSQKACGDYQHLKQIALAKKVNAEPYFYYNISSPGPLPKGLSGFNLTAGNRLNFALFVQRGGPDPLDIVMFEIQNDGGGKVYRYTAVNKRVFEREFRRESKLTLSEIQELFNEVIQEESSDE